MKLTKAKKPGACEAIVALFVFGGQRCLQTAHFVTEDDGELFYVCDEHIAESRRAEVDQ